MRWHVGTRQTDGEAATEIAGAEAVATLLTDGSPPRNVQKDSTVLAVCRLQQDPVINLPTIARCLGRILRAPKKTLRSRLRVLV